MSVAESIAQREKMPGSLPSHKNEVMRANRNRYCSYTTNS